MKNLTEIIRSAKRAGTLSDQQLVNQIREYLQVLILKAIYQSKYGRGLSFTGGTCLRICYTLKRFSEDLDFCLDASISKYSFEDLNKTIIRFLEQRGFSVEGHAREDKVVQKSFIRFAQVLSLVGTSFRKDQKVHIKLEVDTRPVPISDEERESFFVTKFEENFPILKHTNDTLFAGKILAVLNRAYTKGRDFYDLIWHLGRKTKINLAYLNEGHLRQGAKKPFQDIGAVFQELSAKVASVSPNSILKDIGPFLEDPAEETWIRDYPKIFKQMMDRYKSEF